MNALHGQHAEVPEIMIRAGAQAHHPARGVALCLAGVLLFACMDTATKYLAAHYRPPLIVAVRYLVHLLAMTIALAPSQGVKLVRTTRTRMVLLRAACLASGSLFFALALQRMPVAEASAVLFIAPLFVTLMAGFLMRERVGIAGWATAITGFAGVLLIARPGGGLDPIGVACAMGGAMTTAVYQLLSRVLAPTETTIAMLFYTALVGAIGFGAAMPFFWGGPQPSGLQLGLFAGIGLFGGIGHFLFTAAHRHAPASSLAPLQYVQLLWAAVLGWLVFGHVPDAMSIAGMSVVAVAGASVALRSRLAARALEQASET